MKIQMLQTRNIAYKGLKKVGDVWEAEQEMAKQLIEQKFAEKLIEPFVVTKRKPKIKSDNGFDL
tara:strand:- start:1192 stop:1383 length:192 start_codon:yes stop_codon:yes gene_type:complete